MHDVIKWGQAIGLGCFDDAVKYRTGIGATFCVAEQPFFSANDKGLDGSFTSIVMYALIRRLCSVDGNSTRLTVTPTGITLELFRRQRIGVSIQRKGYMLIVRDCAGRSE